MSANSMSGSGDCRAFDIRYEPVGLIMTPFDSPDGMPDQAAVAGNVEGHVEVFEPFADGLAGLESFSHLVLIYHFHRSARPMMELIPDIAGLQKGVFATRAPARPNPIGISTVRLIGIEGRILRVLGVDIMDGTPLLDIKPYISRFDSFPEHELDIGESAEAAQGDDKGIPVPSIFAPGDDEMSMVREQNQWRSRVRGIPRRTPPANFGSSLGLADGLPLAVVKPAEAAGTAELTRLGNRLADWAASYPGVRKVWGLGELLGGRLPRTPSYLAGAPYHVDEAEESVEAIALIMMSVGSDAPQALESLEAALGEDLERICWLTDWYNYTFNENSPLNF